MIVVIIIVLEVVGVVEVSCIIGFWGDVYSVEVGGFFYVIDGIVFVVCVVGYM